MVQTTKDKRGAPQDVAAAAHELLREIDALQAKLSQLFDKTIEHDAHNFPGLSAPTLRALRTTRHCYGFSVSSWLRDETKQMDSDLAPQAKDPSRTTPPPRH